MKYYLSAILPNSSISSNMDIYTELAMQSYHILNCDGNQPPLAKRNNDSKEISIYPNPSSKGFTIINLPMSWKIQVNDIIGKTIWEKQGFGDSNIPIGALPKGLYTATIINLTTYEQVTKKLLVQ